jgi:hypothetical protein
MGRMPMVWIKETGSWENREVQHDPVGCNDCLWHIEEYGEVLVDTKYNPHRHRGHWDGVQKLERFQRYTAKDL